MQILWKGGSEICRNTNFAWYRDPGVVWNINKNEIRIMGNCLKVSLYMCVDIVLINYWVSNALSVFYGVYFRNILCERLENLQCDLAGKIYIWTKIWT